MEKNSVNFVPKWIFMNQSPRFIELLAPAKDAATAIEAIKHGADAVYIGASEFGARASACNSVDDIAKVADFAHRYLAKVYVTVNTIIYNNELHEVERLIRRLYKAGVDALIVQDMGILRLDIPPIALHASTQCDIRTPEKARFLQDVGFSQLVLPREFTLDEIRAVRNAVDVPLEAFVHGALCVSYSGDCHASVLSTGRSANRGECAQICRLPYDLYDGSGNCLMSGRHLLSLRDMNRSGFIAEMLDAGISSFKIEGRLKGLSYVKNVVAYYNNVFDSIVDSSDGKYVRSSVGRVDIGFEPALEKSFNRGFTRYFLDSPRPKHSIASIYTPKSQGEKVGVVRSVRNGKIQACLDCKLSNGDGLAFFDKNGVFTGFRLNRLDGDILYPASRVSIEAGTILYRNNDKVFEDILARGSAARSVAVDIVLRTVSDGLALDLSDERGCRVTCSMRGLSFDVARSPQSESRRVLLSKLGGSGYYARAVTDACGDIFVPASTLTMLRRRAFAMLDADNAMRYRRELRREESAYARWPFGSALTYHDNVANSLAEGFYRSHGVVKIEPALEVSDSRVGLRVVMTARYCLRRELGACLKCGGGERMKGPLSIKSGPLHFGLEFDCKECRMKVVKSVVKR